jgi:hypothetical protein
MISLPRRSLQLVSLTFAISACSHPSTAERFPKLYDAGKSLEAAGATGASYFKFGELVQELTKQIMIARDTQLREEDKLVLAKYDEALATYGDFFTYYRYTNITGVGTRPTDIDQLLLRHPFAVEAAKGAREQRQSQTDVVNRALLTEATKAASEADTLCAKKP